MAKFPFQIDYSTAVPSGRGRNVPMHMDVSTGAESIAKGIGELGGALYEISQKIENTNKILDLSKGRRQREMAQSAALTALKTPGFDVNNDEAVQKIREKAETDSQNFKSKYNDVNNHLAAEYNQDFARWDTTFKGKLLQRKAEKAEDEQKASEMHYYETGDKKAFVTLQHSLEATGAQGSEVTKQKIDDYDNTSMLHRARIDVGNGHYQEAITKLEGLKDLSGKQLDYKDQLLTDTRQEATHQMQQFENTMNDKMIAIDQKDPSPLELRNSADSLEKEIIGSTLPGEQKMKLLKEVRSWQRGEGEIDYERLNGLNERIDHIKQSGDQDPTLAADINSAKLDGAFGKRGKAVAEKYQTMSKRLKTAEFDVRHKVISEAVSDFKADVKEKRNAPELEFIYHQAMDKMVEQHPEWNTAQIFEESRVAAAFYKKIPKEETVIMMKMEAEKREPILWYQKPVEQKKADLLNLSKAKVRGWYWQALEKPDREWTLEDVKAIKNIVGKSETITDDHIAKFEEYLKKSGREHPVAAEGTSISSLDYAPTTDLEGYWGNLSSEEKQSITRIWRSNNESKKSEVLRRLQSAAR
jgi:hypothetical protein